MILTLIKTKTFKSHPIVHYITKTFAHYRTFSSAVTSKFPTNLRENTHINMSSEAIGEGGLHHRITDFPIKHDNNAEPPRMIALLEAGHTSMKSFNL